MCSGDSSFKVSWYNSLIIHTKSKYVQAKFLWIFWSVTLLWKILNGYICRGKTLSVKMPCGKNEILVFNRDTIFFSKMVRFSNQMNPNFEKLVRGDPYHFWKNILCPDKKLLFGILIPKINTFTDLVRVALRFLNPKICV